ncbi:hypothetical protein [Calidifontibacillus oryziterrae]|nr:hypothetical protein [Calidifontibacillus oryziterrae]
MRPYHDAYEVYLTACESYGLESVNYDHFVKYLTEDQLNEYKKKAIS